MIAVTIYETATGLICKNATLQQVDLEANIPDGCSYIEGIYSSAEYKIEDGAAVALPDPAGPTEQELYDQAAQIARDQRSALLAQSDWTQMQDVDSAVSADWQTYRQALRDITAQAGFPYTIDWPTKP